MASDATTIDKAAGPVSGPAAAHGRSPLSLFSGLRLGDYVAIGPFVLFAILFLLLPLAYLIIEAFQAPDGSFTLDNIAGLARPKIRDAFWYSIRVSGASAILGSAVGLLIALAVIRGRLPDWIGNSVMTFSGVASNFAGIPLAFAFLSTLGRLGLVTIIFKAVGIDIYRAGFNLLSFWGLTFVYLYFQIPLMILIIAPAIHGLKREWGEAAATLGATNGQFWRYVGLPVLWPNLLGTLSLLFANAFGAIATAYALSTSAFNIIPILLFTQIRGDVLGDRGLGAALAVGMIVITALANIIYLIVRVRAERWLK
ncbi:MAG TPA: acriflavin resistance protein [Devosia sp.]|nr:acriflavin resistance protein [Devosia sp.]